jgi:hypothetical protein
MAARVSLLETLRAEQLATSAARRLPLSRLLLITFHRSHRGRWSEIMRIQCARFTGVTGPPAAEPLTREELDDSTGAPTWGTARTTGPQA